MKIKQLVEFGNVGNRWLQNPNNSKTKLGYALQRVRDTVDKALKPWAKINTEFQRKAEDINLEYAATDERKLVIKRTVQEQGRSIEVYEYTKENQKLRDEAFRKLQDEYEPILEEILERDVVIEPYFATELPPNNLLGDYEKEVFTGIVIKPESLLMV